MSLRNNCELNPGSGRCKISAKKPSSDACETTPHQRSRRRSCRTKKRTRSELREYISNGGDMRSFSKYLVGDLRAACVRRGLSTKGTRRTLIARLKKLPAAPVYAIHAVPAFLRDKRSLPDSAVLIVSVPYKE